MKSKMDHRSPSRFSTGVPVSANLTWAFNFLAARVCLASGFLMAWASSSATKRHKVSVNQGRRRSEP